MVRFLYLPPYFRRIIISKLKFLIIFFGLIFSSTAIARPDYNFIIPQSSVHYYKEEVKIQHLKNQIIHSKIIKYNNINTVLVSYYGAGEKLSRYTSSGSIFNPSLMTAAHRTLPFGTRLLVEYNNKNIIVVVNDRGPSYSTGRSLDLSYGAAKALGIVGVGVARVKFNII
jgi:rare lipoprotein A (peptidoglycan hydrolase)